MTSIEFQNEHGIYRIDLTNRECMMCPEVFESLIVPVLLAAGYVKESIEEELAL